ncbi:2-methylaconitate cis-trans isomerase PrpF [Vibrio injensis]|uniref:2-methylaconitate cis-trans isomerase PrpF n=1 Tax=Vibrio injensis TaxID=1307414 RepID=UPI00278BFEC8|nr:2-methylaconitate cis-trans isomerase PrpF [Vibrio injensis]
MSDINSKISIASDSTVGSARQIKIPATYLRGGTSNGVFFKLSDLPIDAQSSGEYRDRLLLRVIGSPDAYGKQIDGMGGGSSSTSKVALISKSQQADHDVDYLFGQVAIDQPQIDWSGNCGNLSAAVGPFAIEAGLIDPARIPEQGVVAVKVWQTNIKKTLIIHVPIVNGQVQEIGDFQLDGVAFPAAEIQVEFIDPAEGQGAIFPTGNLRDCLSIPGLGDVEVTLINAGIPTIFLDAHRLGYQGDEGQEVVNADLEMLAKLEMIRAYGALKMGLIEHLEQAKARQHTPKIAFVAPSKAYLTSSGKQIKSAEVDLLVRALSMGKLHHAMMGTAAVAIAAAACVPGTLVNQTAGGGQRSQVTFGHPSGTLTVGATIEGMIIEGQTQPVWQITKAVMSRSARILMEGSVRVPAP